MERTIVVGDVHGCVDELAALLDAVHYGGGDRLVLAGDLVAKGPDSRGVVQLARERGADAVLGNHDARALHVHDHLAGRRPADDKPIKPEHRHVADTLAAEDWAYLRALPLILRLGHVRDGAPLAVVHAGAVPGLPLDAQRPEHLLNLRSITADGTPTRRLDGTPWAERWTGPEHLVFGHDAVRGLQARPFATGLDTGCVYGGRLTALVLPEWRLVSVWARRRYAGKRAAGGPLAPGE